MLVVCCTAGHAHFAAGRLRAGGEQCDCCLTRAAVWQNPRRHAGSCSCPFPLCAAQLSAAPLAALALPPLQILPYLLLFVYFGSLARNLADIFTGKAGLGTNGTIVFAVIRCGAGEMALADGWMDAEPRGAGGLMLGMHASWLVAAYQLARSEPRSHTQARFQVHISPSFWRP